VGNRSTKGLSESPRTQRESAVDGEAEKQSPDSGKRFDHGVLEITAVQQVKSWLTSTLIPAV